MLDGIGMPPEDKPKKAPKAKAKDTSNNTSTIDATLLYAQLEEKQIMDAFHFKKKLIIKGWIVANNVETCIWTKKVKMGSKEFSVGKGLYQIDYTKIQKDKKGLVYNVQANNELGGLSYHAPIKNVDAQVAKLVVKRKNLTAIWGSWQMPLIIALIAIIGAIVGFSLMAVFLAQLSSANACLGDITCMEGKQQAILIKQQQEEAKKNGGTDQKETDR